MCVFLVLGILLITLLFIITLYIIIDAAIRIEKSMYNEFESPFTKADIKYLDSLDKE